MKEEDISQLTLPERVKEVIRYIRKSLDDAGKVILFGSRARGENKGFRDFDLALSLKRSLSWREFALLKNIVLLHTGKIDVESIPSVGTKFITTLPINPS